MTGAGGCGGSTIGAGIRVAWGGDFIPGVTGGPIVGTWGSRINVGIVGVEGDGWTAGVVTGPMTGEGGCGGSTIGAGIRVDWGGD